MVDCDAILVVNDGQRGSPCDAELYRPYSGLQVIARMHSEDGWIHERVERDLPGAPRRGLVEFVLPDRDDAPSHSGERQPCPPVALDVRLKLLHPMAPIRRWRAHAACAAGMQEALVHEHGESLLLEREVRRPRHLTPRGPSLEPSR